MKNYLLMMLCITVPLFAFLACEDDKTEIPPKPEKYTLKVEPTTINYAYNETDARSVDVVTTDPAGFKFSITEGGDWLDVTETATGFTVKPKNENGDKDKQRVAKISVESGQNSETVVVNQSKNGTVVIEDYFDVDPTPLVFAHDGQPQKVEVNTNVQFRASSESGWITIDNEADHFMVTVDEYDEPEGRSGQILVRAEGFENVTIAVTQNGTGQYKLNLTPSEIWNMQNIPYQGNLPDGYRYRIETDYQGELEGHVEKWDGPEEDLWMEIEEKDGNRYFYLFIAENLQEDTALEGTVVVRAKDREKNVSPYSIDFRQAGPETKEDPFAIFEMINQIEWIGNASNFIGTYNLQSQPWRWWDNGDVEINYDRITKTINILNVAGYDYPLVINMEIDEDEEIKLYSTDNLRIQHKGAVYLQRTHTYSDITHSGELADRLNWTYQMTGRTLSLILPEIGLYHDTLLAIFDESDTSNDPGQSLMAVGQLSFYNK